MAVLFLPISTLLRNAPIDPIVLIAALLIGGHPFWALYQNFWVAMMQGMTNNLSFEDYHRVRLAHVYAVMSLLSLTLSVGYWRVIGLWR